MLVRPRMGEATDSTGWDERAWIALILRSGIACLFGIAGLNKIIDGPGTFVEYARDYLQGSWMPTPLVEAYPWVMPFAQLAIAIWLVSGYRLRVAWITVSFYTLTIAVGSEIAGRYGAGANAYLFLGLCCTGLWFSRSDRLRPPARIG